VTTVVRGTWVLAIEDGIPRLLRNHSVVVEDAEQTPWDQRG
jgi:uncharacterized protein YbaR (Trm112 family)